MTSQKRPASAALQHYPNPKHPRVEPCEPKPETETPRNDIGGPSLLAKWKDLAWETVHYWMGSKDDSLPRFNFDPPPPTARSSSIPRTKSCVPLRPPRQHTLHTNGVMPSNILASTSSSRSALRAYPSSSATSSVTNTVGSFEEPESTPRTSRVTSQSSSRIPSQSFTSPSTDPLQDVNSLARHFRHSNLRENGVRKPYRRKHIYEVKHKAKVKEGMAELFEIQRRMGYQSDFSTFEGRVRYDILLQRTRTEPGRPKVPLDQPITEEEEVSYVKRAIQRAKLSALSPKPARPFVPSLDELDKLQKARNEAVTARLRGKRPSLPERLSDAEMQEVEKYKKKKGDVASAGKEKVGDADLERLYGRNKWLNDEIINFYGQLMMDRSSLPKMPSIHYFSSFFWPKLTNDGYEKGRLNRWTKKIDLFKKDYVLIAVNHGNMHWTSAAINFRRKRIESYDSMGISRPEVYKFLRKYLDLEHRDKKKKPFDFSDWTDHSMPTYPQQENGFDCGVFTLSTLEAIARGEEDFLFTQANMKYIRDKMVLEIGRAKLLDS